MAVSRVFILLTKKSVWNQNEHTAPLTLAVLLDVSVLVKDLGHFLYQSAHRKGVSLVCGTTAHILTHVNGQSMIIGPKV